MEGVFGMSRIKKWASLLLAVPLVLTMLLAMPMTAHANPTPATINIGTLAAGNNNSLYPGESQWSFDGGTLALLSADGDYTLSGTAALVLLVDGGAVNATITLNNASLTSSPMFGTLDVHADCTIVLIGDSYALSNSIGAGILIREDISCTIKGDGALLAEGTDTGLGFYLWSGATLSIEDSAEVTSLGIYEGFGAGIGSTVYVGPDASLYITGGRCGLWTNGCSMISDGIIKITGEDSSGMQIDGITTAPPSLGGSGTIEIISEARYPAITSYDENILIDDSITLKLTNGSSIDGIHTFEASNAASTYQWVLTGSATTTDSLTASIIDVTIPAGTTGTISRKNLVCEIVNGGGLGVNIGYESLDDAIAAVPTGTATQTVIRLLANITQNDHTDIGDKKITFNLNGFDLIFAGGLLVTSNSPGAYSYVDYTGNGTIAVVVEFDQAGSNLGTYALVVSGGSYCNVMYVEIKDIGIGTSRSMYAVKCGADSTVVVDGDVVAISNGDDHSWSVGVVAFPESGLPAQVTVNGNIESSGDGIWALEDSIVTVNGDINTGGSGAIAQSSAIVTVNGTIDAGTTGVDANSGAGVIVNGSINAKGFGVNAFDIGTDVIVTGNITSPYAGIQVYEGAKVFVTGNIDSAWAGVFVLNPGTELIVTGNITAGFIGVDAVDGALVFVGGNILITEVDPDWINCGVLVAFGAKVTVDGTITAPNYIAFLIPGANPMPGNAMFYYLGINDNTTPTLSSGYLQYDDEGKYDILASFVWVKEVTTSTPGTGDSAALLLLLGVFIVAALGTGLMLAYRRIRKED